MQYYFGVSSFRRQRYQRVAALVVLGVMIASGYAIYRLVRSGGATVQDSQAIITASEANEQMVTFDAPLFSLKLPRDWKKVREETVPFKVYTWQSTKQYADDRNLSLYIDNIPGDLTLNRMVPVTTQDGVLELGQPSEHCSSLLGKDNLTAQEASLQPDTPAKWQGVTFLCDLSHLNRNAVGIGSKDGLNKVLVTGKTSGKHAYFFLYTDHNRRSDIDIFMSILGSFRTK